MAALHRRAALSRFAALFIMPMVACRQPTEIERMLGPRASTPPPSGNGSCLFDFTGDKADTVSFVVGMLEEHNGRSLIEEGDRIEGFYCNEAGTARLFRRYVGKLAAEQGLDPAVREETSQECLVSYHSQAIADRLNSCYRYDMTNERVTQVSDGTYRRTARAELRGGELFAERRRALSYLAGAWARNGRGKDFVFMNADEKASRVAGLLMNLGCQNVRIEFTVGTIPRANFVHFEPTNEVTEWLRKEW